MSDFTQKRMKRISSTIWEEFITASPQQMPMVVCDSIAIQVIKKDPATKRISELEAVVREMRTALEAIDDGEDTGYCINPYTKEWEPIQSTIEVILTKCETILGGSDGKQS